MPVYDMWCPECGNKYMDKYFRSFKERQRCHCNMCGNLCIPMVPKKLMISLDSTCEGYDEVFDTHLRGKTHRKEVMKEHGVIERDKTPLGRSDRGKWV